MKYKTEVLLEVLAAALMCGPTISAETQDPKDALDDAYDRLCDAHAYREVPFPQEMRKIGMFEWTDRRYVNMRVTEKGLQFLKNGGCDGSAD